MFTKKLLVKNAHTQFSRQARNEQRAGHFELVEKER